MNEDRPCRQMQTLHKKIAQKSSLCIRNFHFFEFLCIRLGKPTRDLVQRRELHTSFFFSIMSSVLQLIVFSVGVRVGVGCLGTLSFFLFCVVFVFVF